MCNEQNHQTDLRQEILQASTVHGRRHVRPETSETYYNLNLSYPEPSETESLSFNVEPNHGN